jgi:uncharacterized protein (DUF2237 family)
LKENAIARIVRGRRQGDVCITVPVRIATTKGRGIAPRVDTEAAHTIILHGKAIEGIAADIVVARVRGEFLARKIKAAADLSATLGPARGEAGVGEGRACLRVFGRRGGCRKVFAQRVPIRASKRRRLAVSREADSALAVVHGRHTVDGAAPVVADARIYIQIRTLVVRHALSGLVVFARGPVRWHATAEAEVPAGLRVLRRGSVPGDIERGAGITEVYAGLWHGIRTRVETQASLTIVLEWLRTDRFT